jgi:Zinc-finger associated domain (zf-AD)/Zinc finger, C2H2 type
MEIASNPINIYNTIALDDLVANLMIDCADIEVFSGDGCPEIVCSMCLTSLQQAYSFQKQIKRSDNVLKELADQTTDSNDAVLEIEIEGCSIQDENLNLSDDEAAIEETKPTVRADKSDNDEDDCTMPRWMLPKYNPNQPHRFYCCLCTDTFETRQQRQQHATDVHCINPNKPLFHEGRLTHSCTVCREVAFSTAVGLDSHLKSKTMIVCPECGKQFNRSTLYKHTKTHQKQKERSLIPKTKREFLPCQYCGKFFAPDRLKYHIARHINGMDYECAHCGKKFKKKR